MKDWHGTPEWASLTQSQKDLFNDVITSDGPLKIRHPSYQLRGDASTLAILGMIAYRRTADGTELTATPYGPQPTVRTEVTAVDFAVPGHYDIGPRFTSWTEAVDHARSKIIAHRYAGQKLRPDVPGFHPKRNVQDGDAVIGYSRAFVQMRVVEPIQERGDGAGPCGSDGVVMTWEVFNDGTVEAVPDSSPKPPAAPVRDENQDGGYEELVNLLRNGLVAAMPRQYPDPYQISLAEARNLLAQITLAVETRAFQAWFPGQPGPAPEGIPVNVYGPDEYHLLFSGRLTGAGKYGGWSRVVPDDDYIDLPPRFRVERTGS
jgi:hypothetical protein